MNIKELGQVSSSVTNQPIDPNSVCVVGSGPVGLAFALRLANAGKSVTLIDSGNFSGHDRGRELNHGKFVSAANAYDRTDPTLLDEGMLFTYYNDHYLSTFRYLGSGGASRTWIVKSRFGGAKRLRIVPGELDDFEARPELDIPAWAAPAAEVHSRYQDALTFFDLDGHTFNIDDYQDSFKPITLPGEEFQTKLFHFALAESIYQNRFDEALVHPGIDVRSGLHLLKIETDKQEKVSALVLCNKSGEEFRIQAEHYVLALGGIENARQLLLAKHEGTLADPHDVFGRWYCDHPHTRLGFVTNCNYGDMAEAAAWYDFQDIKGTPVLRGHEISPQAARALGLPRFSIDLVGRPANICSRTNVALARASEAYTKGDASYLLDAIPGLLSSPPRLVQLIKERRNQEVHGTHLGGWSDPKYRQQRVEVLAVEAMFEQRPSPDNRIRLGSELDQFGRPRPVVQWSWSRKEVDAINEASELTAEAFRKSGFGSFVTMRQLGQREVPRAGSGFHHLGGTRQSHDPSEGVVDAENRVHGVENLTVIGSSIFPNTVGFANPTLTAVADALRVADIFAQRYGVSPVAESYVAD
jgi:choline dehydrogenase-like flavoprotein